MSYESYDFRIFCFLFLSFIYLFIYFLPSISSPLILYEPCPQRMTINMKTI